MPSGASQNISFARGTLRSILASKGTPLSLTTDSVFGEWRPKLYKRAYSAVLRVNTLVGGTPSDSRKAEGWIRTKLGEGREEQVQALAAEIMEERGLDLQDAMLEVLKKEHLNGFKRNDEGLYIEGRQLKACIKEAANIRWPKNRWGISSKGTKSYFAEHVFVLDDVLHIGGPGVHYNSEAKVWEPTGIQQRFVHTFRGNGIQYEEYVEDAEIACTIVTDAENDAKTGISEDIWGQLWTTAEMNGLGASRSQGFGRFSVIKWEPIKLGS